MPSWLWDSSISQLVCTDCKTCVHVNDAGNIQLKHFQGGVHKGENISQIKNFLQDCQPESTAKISEQLRLRQPVPAIAILPIFDGWRCSLCNEWYSTSLAKSKAHVGKVHPGHQGKCQDSLEQCRLQSLSNSKTYLYYFTVSESDHASNLPAFGPIPFEHNFASQWIEIKTAKSKESEIVQAQLNKTDNIPWLQHLGIVEHLQGLDRQITRASCKQPREGNEDEFGDSDSQAQVVILVEAVIEMLKKAHELTKPSPTCRLSLGMCWADMTIQALIYYRYGKSALPILDCSVARYGRFS